MNRLIVGLLGFIILSGGLIYSCGDARKIFDDEKERPPLNIPDGFNFDTIKGVPLTINAFGMDAKRVVVSVYDTDPTKDGRRLQRLNVNGRSSQQTLLTLPTHLESIWVEAMDSDGFVQSHVLPVTGSAMVLDLIPSGGGASLFSSEDCLSGCNSFVSGAVSPVVIDGNQTICVAAGDDWTGQLSFENAGGRFKTCGEANFTATPDFINSPDAEIYVTDTGELNHPGSLAFAANEISIINYGDINITTDLSGTNVEFENFCSTSIGGNYTSAGTTSNNGFINVTGLTSISTGSTFNVGNFSYVLTNELSVSGLVEGPTLGNYGRFDVTNSPASFVNATASIENRVDVCDFNLMTITPGANIDGSVTACAAYIPPTTCTPEVGSLPADDEFPGDPNRIYNNPFPAAGEYGTLMYEDLWPSFGDYDMNDLVIAYHINLITNLVNEVVDIEFFMVIRALGAAYDSGFGIELPVDPARVQSVTGARYTVPGLVNILPNGVEAGQTNAVVILWDESAYEMGKWTNTVDPALHVPEDYHLITLTFDPPVPMADLGTVPFNPFIFIENDRGREVHLPGYEPTDLADPSWFSLYDDSTDPLIDRFYLSHTDLNWAINVPILIPYPRERVNILDAYLLFQSWAESGGLVDTDWYLPFSGYRAIPNMYIGPDLTPPAPFLPPPIPGPPTPGS